MALIRVGEESFNVVVDGPADAPALLLSNSPKKPAARKAAAKPRTRR